MVDLKTILLKKVDSCLNCLRNGWGFSVCLFDWLNAVETKKRWGLIMLDTDNIKKTEWLSRYCLGCDETKEFKRCEMNVRKCISEYILTEELLEILLKNLDTMFLKCPYYDFTEKRLMKS